MESKYAQILSEMNQFLTDLSMSITETVRRGFFLL